MTKHTSRAILILLVILVNGWTVSATARSAQNSADADPIGISDDSPPIMGADGHGKPQPVMEEILGGLGDSKPADSNVQDVATAVRPAITEKIEAENLRLTQFSVVNYKTQVVAGINYYIKIRINDDPKKGYIHARVFRGLGRNPKVELAALQTGHSATDPITFF